MPKKLDKKNYTIISKIVVNRVKVKIKKSKKKRFKLISVIKKYRLPVTGIYIFS